MVDKDNSIGSTSKPDLLELARVYSSQFASPHHITFTLDGLKNLIDVHEAAKAQTQSPSTIEWQPIETA